MTNIEKIKYKHAYLEGLLDVIVDNLCTVRIHFREKQIISMQLLNMTINQLSEFREYYLILNEVKKDDTDK